MARLLLVAVLVLGGCDGEGKAPPSRPAPAAPPVQVGPQAPLPVPDVRLPPSDPVREAGRTVFLPHATAPFDPAKENAVWCATFAMAWDALGQEVLKGRPLLGSPAPKEFVDGMNAHPFPRDALDPGSCITAAGTKAGGILDRIREEGRTKFGKDLPKREISLPAPESILAYAFLRKELPFEHPFETFMDGMAFAGAPEPVRAFGLTQEGQDLRRPDIASQVSILFDGGEGNAREFGIRIEVRGGRDELLLGLVKPGPTLYGTWKAVASRLVEIPGPFSPGSILGIPKVHFDLDHEYREILGAPILNPGFEGYIIQAAWQSILLRMDETGLLLESEGGLECGLGEKETPSTYLFDRPFLIALREKGAREPYLLAWIANTDLMSK